MKPTYSICICNYNMANTIETSLISLLTQINDDFEVIIVDDGSTDNSVTIIKKMQSTFSNIRLISLARDQSRKLGLTRNISIKEAKGEYVLLHLDCDDVFGPHIMSFVKIFHRLEKCIQHDILVSGQHINMARREFLLGHGPYLNIYRGEDRNLWSRMAKIDAWIPLDHIDFITRIPKDKNQRLVKAIGDAFDHLKNDFRSGLTLRDSLVGLLHRRNSISLKFFVLNLGLLLPSYISSRSADPIPQDGTLDTPSAFAAYRERSRGTYPEIMQRNGCDPSLAFLEDKDARLIFSNKRI
ncbi:glycosyltransferase family A protein [Nitratidesulfovibrio vulgaris]|uniref:glycosyltransferase family A protein n=1 Tax=Nitratidesulfovibrio vulgaris TaxID=881 RepID=UPI0023003ED4|nr:glycosyltransferase family A protein [Nitratidesulfovibrio vulgaris]WCB45547.1 glycosyltransferase family A protein [Nitratidesulfovibrio vulgaris]